MPRILMGLSDFLKLTKQVDHKTVNSNQFFSVL